MKERYEALYDYMASSRDPRNMKAFGCVMTEMMDLLIQKMPGEAEEMIDKLQLNYNRARQAAITDQIIEIVAGAEAQN